MDVERHRSLVYREWTNITFNRIIFCDSLFMNNCWLDMDLERRQERHLAVAGAGLAIYDLQTGGERKTCPSRSGMKSVQWYPLDGGLLSTLDYKRCISWWDTERLACVESIGCEHELCTQAWQPEGRVLAVGTDRGVRLVDPAKGLALQTLGLNNSWSRLRWIDGVQLAMAGAGGSVRVYDVRRPTEPLLSVDFGLAEPLSLNIWHDCILILDNDGEVFMIDLAEGKDSTLTDQLGAFSRDAEACFIPEVGALAIPSNENIILCPVDSPQALTTTDSGGIVLRKVLAMQHPRSLIALDTIGQQVLYHYPDLKRF